MKITDEFKSWIGYLEKRNNSQLESYKENAGNNNYTIFAKWYNEDYGENFQGQPWCAMFVTECVKRALGKEMQEKIMPHFAYCPTGVNYFKSIGQWYTKNPKEGDIIFFKDSSGIACHVGYVYKKDFLYVYTIEGNTSSISGVIANGGSVENKKYSLGYSRILGYGRLNIEEEEDMARLEDMELRIKNLENKDKLYAYIPDMPLWAQPAVTKLYNMGILKGDGDKLDLSMSEIRIIVLIVRFFEHLKLI